MAKKLRKLKKDNLSALADRKILKKVVQERIRDTKFSNTLGRLEANKKKRFLKRIIDNNSRNSIESKKIIRRNNEIYFRRDSEVCRERKIRKSEIMAKSGGNGFRVRIARWNADSYIQCR